MSVTTLLWFECRRKCRRTGMRSRVVRISVAIRASSIQSICVLLKPLPAHEAGGGRQMGGRWVCCAIITNGKSNVPLILRLLDCLQESEAILGGCLGSFSFVLVCCQPCRLDKSCSPSWSLEVQKSWVVVLQCAGSSNPGTSIHERRTIHVAICSRLFT